MLRKWFTRPITPDLSPNLGMRDVYFSLGQLLFPWNWQKWFDASQETILEATFRKKFHTDYALSFDSGRTALLAVLHGLNIGKDDEVIMQGFSCVVVTNAIIATGAKPVYVDIDSTYNIDTTALQKLLETSPRVKAVIVQHTFGQPANMEHILSLCKERHIAVIEDCAHSLGATVHNQLVGTLGDAAIFSFGRDKVISSVSGGMAITQRKDVAERMTAYHDTLPYPSRRWVAQRLAYPALFAKAKRLYYVSVIGKLLIECSKRLGSIPLVITPAEKRGKAPTAYRMPGVLARWANHQMLTLEKTLAHRKAIANIYQSGLQKLIAQKAIIPQHNAPATETIWLRWSMSFDRPQALRAFGKTQGILFGNWYDTPIAPHDTDLSSIFYTQGKCPEAEKLSRRIINLPTSVNTSLQDAEKCVSIINQFFRR